MSIRHLDSLFDPASLVVIGASHRPASVGATVWRNVLAGGFKGAIYAVNPKHKRLGGDPVFASVAALPTTPELAIICTPPATVPGLIDALGARGTRAAVVLTAGLDATQRQAMLDAAKRHTLRVLGPNGLGLLVPRIGLNASFAPTAAQPGALAFVSQSGALVTAMLDWASERQIGFSHFVSLGEHADVDFGDMLDFLASDVHTRAVLLYVESIGAARKFMSAARAAARNKPVLVVKAGRSPAGQLAAASHTGALAGADIVIDAAIRRAGMLRVDSLQDLFVAAETLAHSSGLASAFKAADVRALQRLTILTNGGGAGVMAADAAAAAGVELAAISPATLRALNAVLPQNWSGANPIDIIGDAPVQRYVDALRLLQADEQSGTVLLMHAPTAIVPSGDIATALLPLLQGQPARLMSAWLGGPTVQPAREVFRAANVACYDTPEQAVRAFSMLTTYRCNQEQLMEAPALAAAPLPNLPQVRLLVNEVLASGREMFTEPEAKALLEACGIPVVATRVVKLSPYAAAAAASAVGFPVVLKILSHDISHKSDVGGVALALTDESAVASAARAMLKRVRAVRPDAVLKGFTVQAMVQRAHATELIVGTSIDPTFGPVILFGQGGTQVEVVADRAVALPPLNEPLARALVQRTRVAKLLAGWRDVPAADMAAVVDTLIKLSQLLADVPQLCELDINPLLADATGVMALDARVRVRSPAKGKTFAGSGQFAIRPYPSELVQSWQWQGRTVTLRPIRPEDEAQHRAFLEALDPADIRMRIFYSRRSIARSELARLTQIDYDREMAFVVVAPLPGNPAAGEETLAVARAIADPDNLDAEFGIVVRSDLKGSGLGTLLMRALIDYQRGHGTQRLVATVLHENTGMLQLAKHLGFAPQVQQHDDGTQAIYLDLLTP